MIEEKEYLVELLKKSGIKTQVYTSMKMLKQSNAIQVAAVLRNGETFSRSGSKKKYTNDSGIRSIRKKRFERITSFRIIIAESSEERCEKILKNFLLMIPKGIAIDRNWIEIEMGEVDWVEEGDSILKAKIAVQFDVTFTGGIYTDEPLKKLEIGTIRKE